MALPLVLAAVLPILMWMVDRRSVVAGVVYLVSWVVFIVDLVVHMRLLNRYLHTHRGRFDLVVVVLTGPWVFIAVLDQSKFLVVVRLARVARLFLVTKHARRLVEQLGRAALVFVARGAGLLVHRLPRRAGGELGVQGLRRRPVVGGGHHLHGRLRRHHAGHRRGPLGGCDPDGHRHRHHRGAGRQPGQLPAVGAAGTASRLPPATADGAPTSRR